LYGFSSGISSLPLAEELHLGTSLALSAHHWLDSTRTRDKVEQSARESNQQAEIHSTAAGLDLMQKATELFKLERRSMLCDRTEYAIEIDMRGEIVSNGAQL
jgi:hypothetical protein